MQKHKWLPVACCTLRPTMVPPNTNLSWINCMCGRPKPLSSRMFHNSLAYRERVVFNDSAHRHLLQTVLIWLQDDVTQHPQGQKPLGGMLLRSDVYQVGLAGNPLDVQALVPHLVLSVQQPAVKAPYSPNSLSDSHRPRYKCYRYG